MQRHKQGRLPDYDLRVSNYSGQSGTTSGAVLLNKDNVKDILKTNGNLPCQASIQKRHASKQTSITDLEASLADHTDIDNMDEDNKFICKVCSEKGLAYAIHL